MSTVEPLLHFRSDERQLATIRVLAVKDRYAVLVTPAADALRDADTIRFALHYYARALFELVRTRRSPRRLPSLIDRVVASRDAVDVFAAAGVAGELSHGVDELFASEATCVLSSGPHGEIHLWSDFSRLTTRHLVASVLAVLQYVIVHVSPDMIEVLLTALANMNASYGVTHGYTEPAALDEVPANAFRAASFV